MWPLLTLHYIQRPSSWKVGFSRTGHGPWEVFSMASHFRCKAGLTWVQAGSDQSAWIPGMWGKGGLQNRAPRRVLVKQCPISMPVSMKEVAVSCLPVRGLQSVHRWQHHPGTAAVWPPHGSAPPSKTSVSSLIHNWPCKSVWNLDIR